MCSTAQRFIRTEMTTYRIGTLAILSRDLSILELSIQSQWYQIVIARTPSNVIPLLDITE